ncbi:hypothetical protein GE21DRAFT_1035192 [Neurospora crassa]|nr:hypothetical protein GE21DRAFT_1035192 [Neurospora crassa]
MRQTTPWPPEAKGPSAAESGYILTLRVPRQTSTHILPAPSQLSGHLSTALLTTSCLDMLKSGCLQLARPFRPFYPVGNTFAAILVREISNQFSAGRQPASNPVKQHSAASNLSSSVNPSRYSVSTMYLETHLRHKHLSEPTFVSVAVCYGDRLKLSEC